MKELRIVQGTGIPLKRSDVDTDQIIPAEWLKRVERTGFGKGLFSAWRDDRIYRLTKLGRLHALGGRDPQESWSRKWDGRWRLVVFDVPTTQNSRRSRLTRYLRKRGFGRLQNSVWITPDVLEEEMKTLSEGKANVGSMILLDARPCAGEPDADIVTSAWNFERINLRYKQHLKVLDERPKATLRNEEAAKALLNWATLERTAWLRAPSETTTSLHTASKISRRCTAWPLRSRRRTRRSK
jgi:DNA-binding transcriptional regulator PaaX